MLLGSLLIVYRWRGTLLLLINPAYVNVALLAGLCLLGLGIGRWRGPKSRPRKAMSPCWGRAWGRRS